MANVQRWWVAGGTGNTNSTTNWAASSGGLSGASVPVAGDDAFFDGASGTGTVTVNAAFSCHSWDMTNSPNRTVAGTSAITVGGGATNTAASVFTLVAGITWTQSGQFNWDNRSGGHTFTMAGVTCPGGTSSSFFIRGSGNTAATTFADNVTTLMAFQINGTGGVTITSGKTLTVNSFTGNSTFTLTYSGATIACTVTATNNPWDIGGGGGTVTLTGNSSSAITATCGAGTQFISGPSQSYPGTVTLTLSTATDFSNFTNLGRLAKTSGTLTFVNLTINGGATAGSSTNVCTVPSMTVTGALTLAGNSQKNRLMFCALNSNANFTTTKSTITANGTISLTNVDLRNITPAGSVATPWTGTSLGNQLGNTNITFTTPVTRYWVGASGSTFAANANNWATASGGTGTASMPLPQDTATFDATGVTGTTTITNDNTYFPIVDSSNVSQSLTLNFSNISSTQMYQHFCGNLTLSSTTTISQVRTLAAGAIFFNDAATLTVTPNGGTFSCTATETSWQVWTSFTISGASTWTTVGLAGQNVTSTYDFSTGNMTAAFLTLSGTPTITFGEYIYTFNTVTAAQNVLALKSTGALSGIDGASVVISNAAVAVTFSASTLLAIGTLTITGTGAVTSNTTGKVNTIALPFGGTFKPTSGTTLTIKQLEAVGKSGSLITINAVTAASAATLSCVAGIINLDWCSIKDITASGGATFYTGPNTTYSTGNSGWSGSPPTSGPARQQLSMTGCGGY